MIQYKLIKEYPGSPPLGCVRTYDDKNKTLVDVIPMGYANSQGYDESEYPEYWQKTEIKCLY